MFNNMPNLTDEESGGSRRDDPCSKAKSSWDAHEETCVSVEMILCRNYLWQLKHLNFHGTHF